MESGRDAFDTDFERFTQAFAAHSSYRWTFAAGSLHSAELSRLIPSIILALSGLEPDFRGWFLPLLETFAAGSFHLPNFRGQYLSLSRFSPSCHADFRGRFLPLSRLIPSSKKLETFAADSFQFFEASSGGNFRG